ncbi:hypothetical protein HED52_04875 [Ochrobactrum ciceri]|uniref:Uncharacterized protein n=1 Tax=Brucella ciceri TaxID=391287 RepID=A0ABX1DTS1_9HYPH|nr:hypothetical protein [Brucella ciceri]
MLVGDFARYPAHANPERDIERTPFRADMNRGTRPVRPVTVLKSFIKARAGAVPVTGLSIWPGMRCTPFKWPFLIARLSHLVYSLLMKPVQVSYK